MAWLCRLLGHKRSAFDFATGTEECSRCGTVLEVTLPQVRRQSGTQ
jgi:hypothetical protein